METNAALRRTSVLLGVDKVGSAIEFIDPVTCSSLCRLPTPVAPHDIVLSEDQRHAYVTIYGDGMYGANAIPGKQVLVIDVAGRRINDSIWLDPFDSPHGITLDRRGLLWVTSDRHSRVIAFSQQTRRRVQEVGTENTGTHWVLASPVDDLLFCSNKDVSQVTVIDPFRARLVKQIKVPHGTEGMAFAPDGTLYAADHKKFEILVINPASLAVENVIRLKLAGSEEPPCSHHMRLAVSPLGDVLAVASYHCDLLILVDLEAPDRQAVVPTGRGPMALAFVPSDVPAALTPFGQALKLFLSNHDEGTVSVVDARHARVERTFACGSGIEALLFAPTPWIAEQVSAGAADCSVAPDDHPAGLRE